MRSLELWLSTVFAKRLGWSDVQVSAACLGTMNFGLRVPEEDAHSLLDHIVDRGGNFIDVAEMYPAPSSDARWLPGLSEGIIGRWLAKDPSRREKVFLATNVNGLSSSAGCMQPNEIVAGNRKVTLGIAAELNENAKPAGCPARLDRDSIHEAAEASLKRLQTDVTDLYQLHWPDRYRPSIGALCCGPWKERESVPSEETVAAIKELIDSGRIRIWGSSNETTFGVSECQSC